MYCSKNSKLESKVQKTKPSKLRLVTAKKEYSFALEIAKLER